MGLNKTKNQSRKADQKTKKTKKTTQEDKGKGGKSRYSTFVNIPKTNVAIFIGIVVQLIVLANIPFIVDYIISTIYMGKINKQTTAASLTFNISGNLPQYFGLFYNQLYHIKQATPTSDMTGKLMTTLNNAMRDRTIYQDKYIADTLLSEAYSMVLCDLYEKYGATPNKAECIKAVNGKSDYTVFLAQSDVFTYYDINYSDAKSTPSNVNTIISSIGFLYNDMLVIYIPESLKGVISKIESEVESMINKHTMLGLVFIISFPLFFVIYYYVYRVLFLNKLDDRLNKILKSFLVLPGEVLVTNSYVKNYFDQRR